MEVVGVTQTKGAGVHGGKETQCQGEIAERHDGIGEIRGGAAHGKG